jgi:regulator of RNase E activity RraA
MGYPNQVVAPRLRSFGRPAAFAGPALCVTGCHPDLASRLGKPALTSFEIDRQVRPGAVLVIDTAGQTNGSVIGGLMALSCRQAGAIGLVTDGGVRDVEELVQVGLACIAGFCTPASSKGLWTATAIGQRTALPGHTGEPLEIAPGDIVCADADGVVVVPQALAEAVATDAETVEHMEGRIVEALRAGVDREQAFAANARFAHIRRRG